MFKELSKVQSADFINQHIDSNGNLEGISFCWLDFDYRKFSDVLSQWVGKYETVDDFIKSIGLEGEIKKEDIIGLIVETKIPNEKLINYLSVQVPCEICSWLKFQNRGKRAIKYGKNKEQINVPDEVIVKERSRRIQEIANCKNEVAENEDFTQWLADKITVVAKALKRGDEVDIEQSMAGIAKMLGLSVGQLTGKEKITPDLLQDKAEKLANLFRLEGKDFDEAIEQANACWANDKPKQQSSAYSQAIKYLRQSEGIKSQKFVQSEFIISSKIADLDKQTIYRLYQEYMQPIIDQFSQYGLTKEDYLQAVVKHQQLFYQKPQTIIGNIEGVYNHFKDRGLKLDDYLQAALKSPQLFCQKPQTIIGNIEGVCNHFKNRGLKLDDYLQAVINKSSLFCQKPQTIIGNIEGVYNHFKNRGLKLDDYLQVAINTPALFCLKSQTIIDHIEAINAMYQRELFTFYPKGIVPRDFIPTNPDSNNISPLLNYLFKSPAKIIFSIENIKTRAIYAAMDKINNGKIPSTKVLNDAKPKIMTGLLDYLNKDDNGQETPNSFMKKELLKRADEARGNKTQR
jgi:hypothetical protein